MQHTSKLLGCFTKIELSIAPTAANPADEPPRLTHDSSEAKFGALIDKPEIEL